jgi:hypothetical protein
MECGTVRYCPSMSEENVEALHRVAAAANNQDPAILDALLDPEVVWEPEIPAGLESVGLPG